jgi:HEAT repeat protein
VLGDRDGAVGAAVAALEDPYLGARLAAVQLIAEHGDDDARARLVDLAGGDDLFVALRAASNLARAGHDRIATPVDRAITDDSWSVRAAAVNAALDLVDRPRVLELVGRRLADPRIEVRLAAARAMIQLGVDARARPIFVEALDAPTDPARLQGARGLVRLRDPRGREALSRLCKAPSPATRSGAVLAHAQARRPTPGLVDALADESVEVRIDAAETILLLTEQ